MRVTGLRNITQVSGVKGGSSVGSEWGTVVTPDADMLTITL